MFVASPGTVLKQNLTKTCKKSIFFFLLHSPDFSEAIKNITAINLLGEGSYSSNSYQLTEATVVYIFNPCRNLNIIMQNNSSHLWNCSQELF